MNKTEVNLLDLVLSKDFLDTIEKHKQQKENNMLDFFNNKNFCVSKNTINKIQRQDWKKFFANHVSDQGLVSRIYKKTLIIQQ